MTGVSKGNGPQLARFILQGEDRDVVIDGPQKLVRGAQLGHLRLLVVPPIDGEIRPAAPPFELRGSETIERTADQRYERLFELRGISQDLLLLLLVQAVKVHRPQVEGDDRAAMRMRAVNRNLRSIELVFFLQLLANRLGMMPFNADEVERDQHRALA